MGLNLCNSCLDFRILLHLPCMGITLANNILRVGKPPPNDSQFWFHIQFIDLYLTQIESGPMGRQSLKIIIYTTAGNKNFTYIYIQYYYCTVWSTGGRIWMLHSVAVLPLGYLCLWATTTILIRKIITDESRQGNVVCCGGAVIMNSHRRDDLTSPPLYLPLEPTKHSLLPTASLTLDCLHLHHHHHNNNTLTFTLSQSPSQTPPAHILGIPSSTSTPQPSY